MELEKRVIQQMVSVLTASHVVAGKLPYDAIKDAIALYTQTPSVTSAFGFSSQGEGMQQLQGDVQRFVASPPDEWPNILFANLKATSLPDQALKARLILGCAQFGTAAKNMIGILKWQST